MIKIITVTAVTIIEIIMKPMVVVINNNNMKKNMTKIESNNDNDSNKKNNSYFNNDVNNNNNLLTFFIHVVYSAKLRKLHPKKVCLHCPALNVKSPLFSGRKVKLYSCWCCFHLPKLPAKRLSFWLTSAYWGNMGSLISLSAATWFVLLIFVI